jgi:formate hydrogenlyase transcriptional activator
MTATVPAVTLNRQPAPIRQKMVGGNRGLHQVLESVRLVAPTDTTVLITGETGTGKELIAREIHTQSPRCAGPFVKVNCAALPGGLLESELFGHERGAFTGAFMQTTGRFQQAHGGTIFLDEIGDLPLELQPKLLRVLQEQEFERIGSTRTIRVDVRVLAATNLNLPEMIRARQFRADLYYRLNVFPVSLPPLRERRTDIPELAWHFVRLYSARMGKNITVISDAVMEVIQRHAWPGNIRELQNFIERAVILSPGAVLLPPLDELKSFVAAKGLADARTMVQAERDHILFVLERAGGIVGGRDGAAERLGMPRTTLISRMRKLGIPAVRARSAAMACAG